MNAFSRIALALALCLVGVAYVGQRNESAALTMAGAADKFLGSLSEEQRAKAVLEISDWTYVLGGGRLRMEGTPEVLAASPEFVESFLGGGKGPTEQVEGD